MELGTWADWFSAGGSVSASIVALWIASRQERAAKRNEIIEDGRRIKAIAEVKAEAINTVEAMEAELEKVASGMATNPGILSAYSVQDAIDEVGGLRSQLDVLKAYPGLSAHLIGELGRASHDSKISEDVKLFNPTLIASTLKAIKGKLEKRRAAIVKADISVL